MSKRAATWTNAHDPAEDIADAMTKAGLHAAGGEDAASATRANGSLECLVCGGCYVESRLPGLVRCQNCGFISADLDISDEALAGLYGEDYFHGNEYLDYVAEEESLRINFSDRLVTLKKFCPDLGRADLLEIGCAYGFFLEEVCSSVRSCTGVDISADAVNFAVSTRKVDARCADYLALQLDKHVDVIAMWDTIEHLKRPDLFVKKAARDLRTGGLLAVTTGDISSLNARVRGRSWRMIHPPTHLHYFSVATMSRLLNAQGFDVIHVSHPGNSRSMRSIAYFILALQMKRHGLYERIQKYPIFNFRLTINLFDIMYVIARRREIS
jgi:2-polyprenyl-3-methyl-5-hydroxy-6-metoxy-1,4-benzoquinol methylase